MKLYYISMPGKMTFLNNCGILTVRNSSLYRSPYGGDTTTGGEPL